MHSITTRVTAVIGAFLVLLAIIAFQAIYGVSKTAAAVDYLAESVLPQAAAYEQFDLQVVRAVNELSNAHLGRSSEELAAAGLHIAQSRVLLAMLSESSWQAVDQPDSRIAAPRRVLLSRIEQLHAAIGVELANPAIKSSAEVTRASLEQIERECDLLIGRRRLFVSQTLADGAKAVVMPVRSALIAAPLGFLAIGVMAVAAVGLLHRQIVQPVRKLAEVATAIGQGQFTAPCISNRQDEIGDLQRALAQTAANLAERDRSLAAQTTAILEHQRVELELTRARNIAEAANQAKTSFLSMMSHELRTPLTSIIGYSQLLEPMIANKASDEVSRGIHHIHSAAMHLLGIINDVLEYAQIDAEPVPVTVQPTNIADLVHDLVPLVDRLAAENGNRFVIETLPHNLVILTDPLKLHQVLLNVLRNAAKFTENGLIRLTVSQEVQAEKTWVLFRIEDSGIGIAADHMHKLFQPFSQIDDSFNRKYGGTGLGLVISRRLCQLLGGDIDLESAPGIGSSFTVRLPQVLHFAIATDE
ncbi:MAG: HAMP domain-containing protein [Oscillochloris sp.]|nr:HAMP domain-containing protein [Oscillochloris sp.]